MSKARKRSQARHWVWRRPALGEGVGCLEEREQGRGVWEVSWALVGCVVEMDQTGHSEAQVRAVG